MRRRTLVVGALAAAMGIVAAACSSRPATAVVRIGPTPVEFRVELAHTATQQREGLSGRDELPAGTGMLFRFGSRSEQEVWMADMTNPLDVAWIVDGKVLAVDTLSPCTDPTQDQCPLWTSPSAVDALLEVPADSLTAVVPGMSVTIEEQP